MIKIMVDSASDCRDASLYDEFMPIVVSIDGTDYRDGVDLQADAFYTLLTESKEFPRTSQPSPDQFVEVFERVKADGDELIYFALSSELSGTYQGACIARTMADYDGVHIIDTKKASHLIGVMAAYARALIAEGMTAAEVVEACERIKDKIGIYAGLETLEYLRRGGRLGAAATAVATLANVKPIVTVTPEGKVGNCAKALGVPKAIQMIVDKVKAIELDERFPVCALYTFGEDNVAKLEEKAEEVGVSVSRRLQIGPTIGSHVGPGVYGLMYVSK